MPVSNQATKPLPKARTGQSGHQFVMHEIQAVTCQLIRVGSLLFPGENVHSQP